MANRKPQQTANAAATAATATTAPEQPATPVNADQQPSGPVTQITLSDEATVYFGQAGQAYGRSAKAQYERDAELAQHLKECASFELWELARAKFEAGATSVGYAAPNQLWQDTLARCRAAGMIGEKPKASSAEAVKKAEQREAAKKAAEAKQAELAKVNVEATKAAMVKAAAAGDVAKVAELAKLAADAAAAADKAAKDKASAQWRKIVDAFDARVKAIRATKDEKLVAAAYAALAKFEPKATAKS